MGILPNFSGYLEGFPSQRHSKDGEIPRSYGPVSDGAAGARAEPYGVAPGVQGVKSGDVLGEWSSNIFNIMDS